MARNTSSAIGSLLRRHRFARGASEERLALEASVTTRHPSCLETRPSTPCRTMVLALGSALDPSLRERDALLDASAFSAEYRDAPFDADAANDLRRAVGLVLVFSRERGPFVTIHLWRGHHEARLFTPISTIGTPIDATCEELRIETYLPADEATAVPRLVGGSAQKRG